METNMLDSLTTQLLPAIASWGASLLGQRTTFTRKQQQSILLLLSYLSYLMPLLVQKEESIIRFLICVPSPPLSLLLLSDQVVDTVESLGTSGCSDLLLNPFLEAMLTSSSSAEMDALNRKGEEQYHLPHPLMSQNTQ